MGCKAACEAYILRGRALYGYLNAYIKGDTLSPIFAMHKVKFSTGKTQNPNFFLANLSSENIPFLSTLQQLQLLIMPAVVTFVNQGSQPIELMETGPGFGPNLLTTLKSGTSFEKTYTGPGWNFRVSTTANQTLAVYTVLMTLFWQSRRLRLPWASLCSMKNDLKTRT